MQDFVKQQERRDYNHWLADKVDMGRTAARKGELHSGEDVEARFAAARLLTPKRSDAPRE